MPHGGGGGGGGIEGEAPDAVARAVAAQDAEMAADVRIGRLKVQIMTGLAVTALFALLILVVLPIGLDLWTTALVVPTIALVAFAVSLVVMAVKLKQQQRKFEAAVYSAHPPP